MLAVDRAGLQGLDAIGGDAAWRRTIARPPDLSHAERVTLGEAREAGDGGSRPSARATADVRWYRAAQARRQASAAASPQPGAAPEARPVHTAVRAYQRTMAMDRE